MKLISKNFFLYFCGAIAAMFVHMPPALSLPRDMVERKFQQFLVYSVFSVPEDGSNASLIFREESAEKKIFTSPGFVDQKMAEKYLRNLSLEEPGLENLRLLGLPLTSLLEMRSTIQSEPKYKNKTLKTPIFASSNDLNQAKLILLREGVPEDDIKSGLNVPLFYTIPTITIKTSEGPRQAFFTSLNQLNSFIASSDIDKSKLKIRVADINVVMGWIEKEEKDLFVVYPSPAYILANPSVINN